MKNFFQNKAIRNSVVALILYFLLAWMISSSVYPNGISFISLLIAVVIGILLVAWVYKANMDKE